MQHTILADIIASATAINPAIAAIVVVTAIQIVGGPERETASKQACAQRKSVLDLFIAFYHAV